MCMVWGPHSVHPPPLVVELSSLLIQLPYKYVKYHSPYVAAQPILSQDPPPQDPPPRVVRTPVLPIPTRSRVLLCDRECQVLP